MIDNNLLYVSELSNNRISIFDTNGCFIHCFGKRGSGEGEFYSPHGITVTVPMTKNKTSYNMLILVL